MTLKVAVKINYEKVLYLAVLPKYRTECIGVVRERLGSKLALFVSESHLDSSVRTGIPSSWYEKVAIYRFFGNRAFLQFGHLREALTAETTVVDLNPRSLSAWIILILRALGRKRTLAWGHINPQKGRPYSTAALRLSMRRLAAGTISYTYRDAGKARNDLPGQKVWTAPNSLYLQEQIYAVGTSGGERNDVLYVGRFARAKKVELLVRGFAQAAQTEESIRLVLVGGGEQERHLRHLVDSLGIQERVSFPGWIDDLETLRPYYERAYCTVSPGFAGLGLTQSLGFGVPMLIAEREPHSPEIELEETGGVTYFDSDSPDSLANEILQSWENRKELPHYKLSEYVRKNYSAEAMADGLIHALLDEEGATPIVGGDVIRDV